MSSEPFISTLHEWIEVFMRRSMRNFLLHSKATGLSMTQFGALFHIHRHGACRVSDFGDELGITTAAASQMVDRLVQQGFISRTEDPNDRRLKQIALTEAGERVLKESIHARQIWLEDLPAVMSAAEQEQVIATLKLLIEKARQLENPHDLET